MTETMDTKRFTEILTRGKAVVAARVRGVTHLAPATMDALFYELGARVLHPKP